MGYTASLCTMLLPMLTSTLRSNSPDMLTTLLVVGSLLLLLSQNLLYRYFSLPVILLLIFTRPENSTFVLCFGLYVFFSKPSDYTRSFASILILIPLMSYLLLIFFYKPYPWTLLYRHSFLGYIANVQNSSLGLSFQEYVLGFRFLAGSVLYSDFFMMIFLLLTVLFYKGKQNSRLSVFAKTILLSLIVRVLLFPDLSSRFFSGFFIISVVLFLRQFSYLNKGGLRAISAE